LSTIEGSLSYSPSMKPGALSRHRSVFSNHVLGMLIFIFTELMFFTGVISAYIIIKAGRADNWVPPGEVRLPVEATAFNTLMLLISGVLIFLAGRKLEQSKRDEAITLFTWSIILGAFFVVFQGSEWVQLMAGGMTMKAGVFSACFYLLIGSHAFHATAAIIAMLFVLVSLRKNELPLSAFRAMQLFWGFVVAIWPVLYVLVYF